MSHWDRITVVVDGVEIGARPIDFLFDVHGLPEKAIKWETTNPKTGQLLQFGIDEVTWVNEKAFWGMPPKKTDVVVQDGGNNINISKDVRRIPITELKNLGMIRALQEMKKEDREKQEQKLVQSVCPFVDPIAQGIFKVG
jgi:nitrogen-specific signal transduction histidine kinase